MSKLDQIIRTGRDGTALLFRPRHYRKKDQAVFLRDVIALANAEVEGTRLIVVGVEKAEGHQPQFHAVAIARMADAEVLPFEMTNVVPKFGPGRKE